MKTEEKIQVLRFLLMVVNGIFVILGLAILGCGVWILFDKGNFIVTVNSEDSMEIIAGGLLVTGLLVITVSAFGCLGALKEVRCILSLYMGLLSVIFIGQIFIAIILQIKKTKIAETILTEVDQIIVNYGNNTESKEKVHEWDFIDSVQYNWKCCGRTNYSQWENNLIIKSLSEDNVYPCSCFNISSSNTCPPYINTPVQRFGEGVTVYSMGCQALLDEWLSQNALVIIGMILGLVFIQIFLFVLAVYLLRNIARKVKERRDRKKLSPKTHQSASNAAFEDSG